MECYCFQNYLFYVILGLSCKDFDLGDFFESEIIALEYGKGRNRMMWSHIYRTNEFNSKEVYK